MLIIIDTREQRPWGFPAWLKTKRGTLRTGDYALDGDLGFAIERKGLDDFLGTVSTGWERFVREIERMGDWGCRVIVVEGSLEDCCWHWKEGEMIAPAHNHPKLTPAFVISRVAELTFMGVSVLFAGNSDIAAAVGYRLLKKRNEDLYGRDKGGSEPGSVRTA